MFLKQALNALTRLHSRVASLKRLGTVDLYSPCRLTPANYFRFLRGPELTTVKGVEFIIPVDSMTGQYAQKISFDAVPDAGDFEIKIGADTTNPILFSATAADVQTELRLIPALANVVVSGDFDDGFVITFVGFSSAAANAETVNNNLTESTDPVDTSWEQTFTAWTDAIKKGDRIIDGSKLWSVDEIVEMHDLGAEVMAYRVRCD